MPAPRKAPAKPKLPPVTVARFDVAIELVEALVDEQTDTFIAKGQEYRDRHREGTTRKLTAQESAQVASAMASLGDLNPVSVAVAVQESDLRGYDEPEPVEILLRAGVATAPAALASVLRFVALVEMPADVFMAAREADGLDGALDEAVKPMAYAELDGTGGMRARAVAAFEHFGRAAGAEGKALSLFPRALWQAVQQATSSLGLIRAPSSLTGSPPSTGGDDGTSSMTSATSGL
jgi:hypothetical protein